MHFLYNGLIITLERKRIKSYYVLVKENKNKNIYYPFKSFN